MRHPVFVIALLSSGCARWVFNEKYIECEPDLDVVADNRETKLHIRPRERDDCSIRVQGLFGGNAMADDGRVESEGVALTTVRYDQTDPETATFESIRMEWSEGAEIAFARLTVGDGRVRGLDIKSGGAGVLTIGEAEGFDLSRCEDCSVAGVFDGFPEVGVTITDPREGAYLCLTEVPKVRLHSRGSLAAAHNLAFTTGASADVQSDNDVVVAEPSPGAVQPEADSTGWVSAGDIDVCEDLVVRFDDEEDDDE